MMNIYYSFFTLFFRFFETLGVGFAYDRDYKANTVALFLSFFEFANFKLFPTDLAGGYQIMIGLGLYAINLAIFLPKSRFEKILKNHTPVPTWHKLLFFLYIGMTIALAIATMPDASRKLMLQP
jgi:hypothetical protein